MFKINQDKLKKVVKIINEKAAPAVTAELIETEISFGPGSQEHQDWLNTATPEEIADWLASFYSQN